MTSILCRGFSKLIPNLQQTKMVNIFTTNNRSIFLQSCLYRAKKSTRERKLKMHRKRKAQKATANLQKSSLLYSRRKRKSEKDGVVFIDDSGLPLCEDDVWFMNMFKLHTYSFVEAVNAFRESHHPTMFNEPTAFVHAFVELDMSTDKKTKFYENFVDVVSVKYPYKHQEDRSIIAFCKTKDQVDLSLDAGAALAGGQEIITAIKKGKIVLPDFQFFIAQPTILPELTAIRGLLRRRFPTLESGMVSPDLPALIHKLKIGIRYESKRDEFNPRFGWVDVQLGQLDTEIEHLEDNLRLVLANIRKKGPRRTKNTENYKFVNRCFIQTQLHREKLLIPVDDYLEEEEIIDSDDEDDEVATG